MTPTVDELLIKRLVEEFKLSSSDFLLVFIGVSLVNWHVIHIAQGKQPLIPNTQSIKNVWSANFWPFRVLFKGPGQAAQPAKHQ